MGRLIDADKLIKSMYEDGGFPLTVADKATEKINEQPTVCEPGIVAEYIKERHPSLLQSADFALYQITYTARKCVDMFVDAIKGVDWGELAKYAKNQEEGAE